MGTVANQRTWPPRGGSNQTVALRECGSNIVRAARFSRENRNSDVFT